MERLKANLPGGVPQAPNSLLTNGTMTQTATRDIGNKRALWVLMLGNFIIGTGILLPAGLLNDLVRDFAISPARAGLLLLVGGS